MLSAAVFSPYSEIFHNIASGHASGKEELRRVFGRGVRLLLARHLPPRNAERRCQQVFVRVEQAILAGEVCEPEQLPAFIRTVVKQEVETRPAAAKPIHAAVMAGVLESLPRRDREALTRLYLGEQTERRICADLRLSEDQFRLIQSKVRRRFADLLS